MKCPNCKYEPDTNVSGCAREPGWFFELETKAKQPWPNYMGNTVESVYGCPKCGVMFMETYWEQ